MGKRSADTSAPGMLPSIDGRIAAAVNGEPGKPGRLGRETHVNDTVDAPCRIEGRRADPARNRCLAYQPIRARCLRRWNALGRYLGSLGPGSQPGSAADLPAM